MALHLWLCPDDFKRLIWLGGFSKYRWNLLNSHSILRHCEKWAHWVMIYVNFKLYLLK